MTASARALLEGIIDYAGLFPPASLSMKDAFARFLGHRRSPDGWMLSRFVCPAARLAELEPLLEDTDHGRAPVAVAALGRGGATVDEFKQGSDEDAAAIRAFAARQAARSVIDVFEVRLPEAGGVATAVEHAWRSLGTGDPAVRTCFFEASLLGEWRPRLPAAASAVRDVERASGRTGRVGLKIRCGGLEAFAVPEPMAVAAAIATSRAVGVPLKATQGLHHPFRHHDPQLGVEVHGFLNLFAAAVMAHVHDLPVTRLAEIIGETDPAALSLSEERLVWRDLAADPDEVRTARGRLLTGFGSCSFSEPRDELRTLQLID